MPRNVPTMRVVVDGNDMQAVATPTGLDINDAVYHTAHDYPGGVPALAQRMGMSQHSLAHKVGLNNAAHLSPTEMVKLQAIAGDARILQAQAAALGYSCISMAAQAGAGTLAEVMHMAQEFADVLTSVNSAVADGRVTLNEMRECERQAGELMLAINGVLATVRSMMPPAPEARA